jgi:hypothetical protein
MFNQLKNLFKPKEQKSIADLMKPIGELEKKPTPIEIDLPVTGNYQLDNKAFPKIPASSQCGYTSLAVLLSQFIPEAKSDEFIYEMIKYFEKDFLIGKARRFGSMMQNHVFMAQFYLKKYGINRQVIFKPHSGTVQEVIEVLQKGYAVGVAGMMTGDGHFMVISGYSELRKAFKMQDPYKLFDFDKGKYTNQSGLNVYYPVDRFLKYLEASSLMASQNTKKGIRFYYIGDKI